MLAECFRLVCEDGRTGVHLLTGETSHRKKAINGHVQKFGTIRDAIIKVKEGKIAFDKGQETEEEISGLLEKVNKIVKLLNKDLIAPLDQLRRIAPDDDNDGCEADLMLETIIDSEPWKKVFELAKQGYQTVAPARTEAIDRLRMMAEPHYRLKTPAKVFVASTSEGLSFAEELAKALERQMPERIQVTVWKKSPEFKQGGSNLRALETVIQNYRFGVAIISPADRFDDEVRADGTFPIGNVLLEHGMFIGKHTRYRAFLVQPREGTPGLSDLSGIVTARYDPKAAMNEIVAEVSKKIEEAIDDEMKEAG
ncbi:MAG: nucleotide-binding protein [Akkermansiaceae bacterium]|nr:nucleotide-binding protein [Akkermansiaceae bacterium]